MTFKAPLYVLPNGIEVVGEYAPKGVNRYWRVRIRPHAFFPDAAVQFGGVLVRRSRAVLAAKLGRALTAQEHAHHGEDGPHADTDSNLEVLTPAEHNRHHKTGSRHRAESRAQTSATLKQLYAAGLMVPHPIRGSRQASAKLTEETAAQIKHSTELTRHLVARYGVSRTIVKQIRNGKIWKHVP